MCGYQDLSAQDAQKVKNMHEILAAQFGGMSPHGAEDGHRPRAERKRWIFCDLVSGS
jgi:hypothetical protein